MNPFSPSLYLKDNLLDTRKPSYFSVEVSSRCIMKCKMCYAWKKKYEKDLRLPTLNEWACFMDLLSGFNDNAVKMNFSGAEPLADKMSLKVADLAAKKGFFTMMCTNGFLVDQQMVRDIVEAGLKVVIISLDGAHSSTHDFLRGKRGAYDRVMQAIEFLSDYKDKIEIGIQTIILEKNMDEIIELTDFINRDDRVKFINFQAVANPFGSPLDKTWHKKHKYDFLWPQDTIKAHRLIDDLIRLKKSGYKISNRMPQLEMFKRYFEDPRSFIRRDRCNVDFYMSVDQLGDVYMCWLKKPIGNIMRNNPKEIWYSAEADQRRKEIRSCKTNCHLLVNCGYEE